MGLKDYTDQKTQNDKYKTPISEIHPSVANLPAGSYPLPKFCRGKNNDVL
jgi:hypothetical protein